MIILCSIVKQTLVVGEGIQIAMKSIIKRTLVVGEGIQ